MKILVAEHDAQVRASIKDILSNAGHTVFIASKGRESIEVLKNTDDIDLFITNNELRDISGINLLRYVKNDRKLNKVQVLFISTNTSQQTILTAIKEGVAGYVAIPVADEVLLRKIRQIQESIPGAVLIVDDEEVIRSLLKRVIEHDGYKVLTAADGSEALKIIKCQKVSAVISDIKMPGMTGDELLFAIKKDYPNLPVMLMTGFKLDFNRTNALSLGADNFISKPFKNTEILHKLSLCMNKKQEPRVL